MTTSKVPLSRNPAAWTKVLTGSVPIGSPKMPEPPTGGYAPTQSEVDQMIAGVRAKFPGLDEDDLNQEALKFISRDFRLMPNRPQPVTGER